METMQECDLSANYQEKFLGANARALYNIDPPSTFITERVTEIERPDWWPTEEEIAASMPAEMGLRPEQRSRTRSSFAQPGRGARAGGES